MQHKAMLFAGKNEQNGLLDGMLLLYRVKYMRTEMI